MSENICMDCYNIPCNHLEEKKMKICKYINCGEPVALEGKCGGHYNSDREYERNKPKLRPVELKKAQDLAKQLDAEAMEELVNPEWWFEQYGEQELPAKFMNPHFLLLDSWNSDAWGEPEKYHQDMAKLTKSESMILNEKLKDLDGTPINGGTHVWRFVGRQHFKRDGVQNHFACVKI